METRESTRRRILELLWRGERTVDELAGALGLTANAVRAQLLALERDGLVAPSGRRPSRRRPAVTYACTPAAARLLAKPYGAVLRALADEIVQAQGRDRLADLFRRIGERFARQVWSRLAGLPLPQRVGAVADLLREMGAVAEVEAHPVAGYLIAGYSCPLQEVVAAYPEACAFSHALLSGLFPEGRVRAACQVGEQTRCRFTISGPGGQASG